MPLIEIWDRGSLHTEHGETSQLAFDLRELLVQLPPDKKALNWSILGLWAVAQDDTDVGEIEARVDASPVGLRMTGAELWDLAGRLLQVIDGTIVAFSDSPPTRSDSDLRESCEIVIEAIDSTLWRVYTRDPAVSNRLRQTFADVREVSPEVPMPAVRAAA